MKRIVVVLVSIFIGLASFASTQVVERKDLNRCPMAMQVEQRIAHQQKQITAELKAGKLTSTQARQMRWDLATINHEKNRMQKKHDGKLTKGEQKNLNSELNITRRNLKS